MSANELWKAVGYGVRIEGSVFMYKTKEEALDVETKNKQLYGSHNVNLIVLYMWNGTLSMGAARTLEECNYE